MCSVGESRAYWPFFRKRYIKMDDCFLHPLNAARCRHFLAPAKLSRIAIKSSVKSFYYLKYIFTAMLLISFLNTYIFYIMAKNID